MTARRGGMLVTFMMFISHWAFAQSPSELNFQSRFDQFQLKRSGSQWMLADRSVKLGAFQQLMPIFERVVEGDCPKLGRADFTVTAKIGDQTVERRFYVEDHLVSDGKQCGSVNGEGIYFAPLHRSWFDDNAKMTVALESPVVLTKGEETLVAIERTNGEWRSKNKQEFPNFEFVNSFQDSLRDFAISHRLHRAAAKDKPGFVMMNGRRKFEFFKINSTLWAAAIPGQNWLIGSPRWTSWGDMEKTQWLDRHSEQLVVLADISKSLDERKLALANVDGQWSPSIRNVLAQILLSREEPIELKSDAVRILRNKPTTENMSVFIRALTLTEDSDLQYHISNALKARNPKGPQISVDLDGAGRRKAITEWQRWWSMQKDKL